MLVRTLEVDKILIQKKIVRNQHRELEKSCMELVRGLGRNLAENIAGGERNRREAWRSSWKEERMLELVVE